MTTTSLITTTIFPSRYIQGPGALDRLPALLQTIVPNPRPYILAPGDGLKLPDVIMKTYKSFVHTFKGECTHAEINLHAKQFKECGANVIIGIGGGKTLDTAKAVGFRCTVPSVICPTIASTDAPCSALSIIYSEQGEVVEVLKLPKNPDAVLVDTSIIIQAPTRFLIAGIGDALSTWFEAESCMKKHAANCASTDTGSLTGYALAKLCYKTLLKWGPQAVLANDNKVIVPAFEKIVEANTLLSGLGFESAGLATAHSIHNGLTKLPETHSYYHGEKVTIGVLASLFITEKSQKEIDKVYSFCESVRLPTTLSEIGLSRQSDLLAVAVRACDPTERIWSEPYPVSPAIVVNALKMADAYGKERK